MIRATTVFVFTLLAASVSANPIAHFLRRGQDSSYSEAYVPMMAPTKLTFDHKALLHGLNTAKNCLGKLATYDSNEYAHFDNPLQLGFVPPPALPIFSLRSKEQTTSNEAAQATHESHSSGHPRFDFWIPL